MNEILISIHRIIIRVIKTKNDFFVIIFRLTRNELWNKVKRGPVLWKFEDFMTARLGEMN